MGALTTRINKYNYRFWESKSIDSLDLYDSNICKIKLIFKGSKLIKVMPNLNKSLNQEWVSDKLRFSFDSLYNQKLDSPLFLFDNKYLKINWKIAKKYFYFEYVFISLFVNLINKNGYKNKPSFFFFIGDNLDRSSLIALSFLVNFYKNKNISSFFFKYTNNLMSNKNNVFEKHLKINKKLDFLKNIESIFFLNINLRLENPVLNLYLSKYKSKISFFSFGFLPNFSFDIKILSNNVNSFIKFIEGNSIYNFKINNYNKVLFFLSSSILFQSNGSKFLSIFRNNNNFFFINQFNIDLNLLDLGLLNYNTNDNKNIFDKNINIDFFLSIFLGTFKFKINENLFKNNYTSLFLKGTNIYQGFYFNEDNYYNLMLPAKSLYESKYVDFINIFGNYKIFNCLDLNFKNYLSNANIFWFLNSLTMVPSANTKMLGYTKRGYNTKIPYPPYFWNDFLKKIPYELNYCKPIYFLLAYNKRLLKYSFSKFSIKITNNKFKFNKILFNTNIKLLFLNSFVLNSKKLKDIVSNYIFINFNFFKIKKNTIIDSFFFFSNLESNFLDYYFNINNNF